MHPGSPDAWRVIWVVAAGFFLLAEMVRRLRLWFLPFAVGAGVAAGTAFAGVALPWEWVAFVGSSAITLAALRPLGRRLAWQAPMDAVGSRRWIGQEADVVENIPARGGGWVRLGRERWRAESGLGIFIPAGTRVLVTGMEGMQLTVLPLDAPFDLPEVSEPASGHEPDQGG
jgi:membrane protein implicated in regulation of membrane protease activity